MAFHARDIHMIKGRFMGKKTLAIELHGNLRFTFDNQDITAKLSKKSIGLIAYLLCSQSRQASKNTLEDLLWTDAGEKAAYNLRFNLWNIKKYIPEVEGQNFILSAGGVCRINPEYPLEQSGLTKLESWDDDKTFEEGIERLARKDMSLTFMEHFYLNGCDDFNDWLMLERSNRERRLTVALTRVADYLEEKGQFNEAIDVLKKLIHISPFEDTIHIRVMKIYQRMGNTSEAIKEYKSYCKWLQKELAVMPSGELKTAYFDILRASKTDEDGSLHIKEKVYDSDYAAICDMFKTIFAEVEGMVVKIDNWDGLDKKSKELLEVLSREKIITLGGK